MVHGKETTEMEQFSLVEHDELNTEHEAPPYSPMDNNPIVIHQPGTSSSSTMEMPQQQQKINQPQQQIQPQQQQQQMQQIQPQQQMQQPMLQPQYMQPQYMQPQYMPPPQQPTSNVVVQSVVSSQPQTTTMSPVENYYNLGTAQKDWSSKKGDCCEDMHSCCCAFLFPHCFAGCLATRMNESHCATCCVPGGIIAMRAVLRSRHGIKGSICGDCCDLYWCGCCVLCQMSREMDKLGYPKSCC